MSILISYDSNKTLSLVKKLVRFNILLSLLSYSVGLVFFAHLIDEPMKTSVHDNSLLPGLADREFVDSKLAQQLLFQLENITAEFPENYFPFEFLKKQFENIGLEVYDHRFRFRYPFGYQKKPYDGMNLYAVFRAPRAASTESIVISAPYRSKNNPHGSNLPSIALMLSLANFFKTRNYWAKDIIYLIFSNELLGIQAWLQAYQGLDHNEHLKSNVLLSKAGVIQAALNLELQSLTPPYIQLNLEGLNGQLPNLDLFNVAVELCYRESMPVVFHGNSFFPDQDFDNWLRKAKTMTSMMVTQATMLPTGAHGLFQKYAISSITLKAPNKKPKLINIVDLSLGRSIEGIVRSLNNMMEKFNRSFYFYLLASTRRFISISSYMIVFGLLAAPLSFRSLYYYFKAPKSDSRDNFDFWASFKPCFLSHLFGILALSIVPIILTRLDYFSNGMVGALINNVPVENVAYSIFVTVSFISLNPFGMISNRSTKSFDQYCLQSMVALLNGLLLLTSISLINISLALALTSIYVPLLTIVSVQDHQLASSSWFNPIKRILKFVVLLSLHPIILHLICLFGLSLWVDSNLGNSKHPKMLTEWILLLWKHLKRAFNSQPKTLLNFIEDWYLYDNWAFPLTALFVWPVWLQLWFQAITSVK